MIDFSPVRNCETTLAEFGRQFTVHDLKRGASAMIDMMLTIIEEATDEQVTFIPHDPEAYDPHAAPEEQHVGWSVAHLIAHTTASTEEGAAHSSILARGIPYTREPRLRYETPWQAIRTRADAEQRLEESRRIVLAYLDAWPDEPHLDVYRDVSPRFVEKHGPQNATVAFLHGLMHQDGHLEQMREVLRQAEATLGGDGRFP